MSKTHLCAECITVVIMFGVEVYSFSQSKSSKSWFTVVSSHAIHDKEVALSVTAVVDGHCSSLESINSGIPQGSILLPTLFILFIMIL